MASHEFIARHLYLKFVQAYQNGYGREISRRFFRCELLAKATAHDRVIALSKWKGRRRLDERWASHWLPGP